MWEWLSNLINIVSLNFKILQDLIIIDFPLIIIGLSVQNFRKHFNRHTEVVVSRLKFLQRPYQKVPGVLKTKLFLCTH